MTMLLGAMHMLALVAALAPGVAGLRARPIAMAAALGLLAWTNLVLTGHALSLFGAMNVAPLYVAVSLLLAAGASWALPRLRAGDQPPPDVDTALAPRERLLVRLSVLSGVAVLALNLLIAGTHLPSNPDSIVYRFPRVYWYLGAGSLAHFAAGTDPRLVYYPTNGPLLYFPLALYGFGPLWFNLPTLVAWCAAPLLAYAFARELGARAAWAVGAAWMIALTPNVLVQALATNDEILAAVAMLAGLFFLHRWSRHGSPHDLFLAACGVGLSAGTKLHVFFYWPYLLIVALAALWSWRRVAALVAPLATRRGAAVVAGCGLLAAAMVGAFLIHNRIATGQLTDHGFARQVLNSPFDPRVSLQTIVVYVAQIVIGPFADLTPTPLFGGTRAGRYLAFNALFAPAFQWVSNAPEFVSVHYRFEGVTQSTAYLLNEHALLLGFSWLVAAMAAGWAVAHRGAEGVSNWAVWIALSPFAWFLGWAGSTKFIEGIGPYLVYPAVISAPAWAFAFAPLEGAFRNRAREAILAFVALAHVALAVLVLFTGNSRSIQRLARNLSDLPISRSFDLDPSVRAELARPGIAITHYTIRWGRPHFAFMSATSGARHRLRSNYEPFPGDSEPDPGRRFQAYNAHMLTPRAGDASLHFYSFPTAAGFGVAPLRPPWRGEAGLTHVGNMRFTGGPEWVFAAGDGVRARHPGRSGYLIMQFREVSDFGRDPQPYLEISPEVYGVEPGEDFEFRYSVTVDGERTGERDWERAPSARLGTSPRLTDANGVLTIDVRSTAAPEIVATRVVRLRSWAVTELP